MLSATLAASGVGAEEGGRGKREEQAVALSGSGGGGADERGGIGLGKRSGRRDRGRRVVARAAGAAEGGGRAERTRAAALGSGGCRGGGAAPRGEKGGRLGALG